MERAEGLAPKPGEARSSRVRGGMTDFTRHRGEARFELAAAARGRRQSLKAIGGGGLDLELAIERAR